MIRAMSARGVIVGTVETAQLPALMAATSAAAKPGGFYGPSGPGHLGGPPGEQELYSRQTRWASEELTGTHLR